MKNHFRYNKIFLLLFEEMLKQLKYYGRIPYAIPDRHIETTSRRNKPTWFI